MTKSFAYDTIGAGKAKRGRGPRTKKKMKALQARIAREARNEFAEVVDERKERDDD